MTEFRVYFSEPRAVNVTATDEKEAREIVKKREWEYGMDWDEGEPEVTAVEELS